MSNPTQPQTQTHYLRLSQRSILEAIIEILEFMDRLEEPDARLVALLVRYKYEDKFGRRLVCHEG